MLETCKVAQFPFQAGQDVQLADWELYIQVQPCFPDLSCRRIWDLRSGIWCQHW